MIKRYIPAGFKIRLHLLKNVVKDFTNGYMFCFAKRTPQNIDDSIVFSLTQDLKSNEFKKQNILKAKSFIDHVTIWPDQIFSFWKIVGNPSKKRGFVQSRSLVNGETIESYGGGLCQLPYSRPSSRGVDGIGYVSVSKGDSAHADVRTSGDRRSIPPQFAKTGHRPRAGASSGHCPRGCRSVE